MRRIAMPVPYDAKTIDYVIKDPFGRYTNENGEKVLARGKTESITGKTTPQTWQLWKQGYVVLKNFIPKEMTTFAMDTWKTMEHDPENWGGGIKRENDIIHNSPEDTLYKSEGLYNSPFGVALHRFLWDKLKLTIDMDLEETYSYSRKYERGAYLKAHADRPSCEISGTLCLDYKTDDGKPWTIWVDNSQDYINHPDEIFEDTQAKPIRERKTAKKIVLEVGDLLLYQGPNVAHWREKLLGEYSYHVFIHFSNFSGVVPHLPGVHELVEEIYPEVHQNNWEYNPVHLDGRRSRYHPIDEDCPKRKCFSAFQERIWGNPQYWLLHNKSDYVNNFEDFVQIKDGEEVMVDTFKPKYLIDRKKVERPR